MVVRNKRMKNICNSEENVSPKELTPAPYFQFFKHFNPKVKMTDKLRKTHGKTFTYWKVEK